MRVKMTVAAMALAMLAVGLPASASANGSRTVHVDPGESIQAAIDKAKPGTTIKLAEGTYAGSLLIDKDGIELVGEGRKKTKIVEPATPDAGGRCVEPGAPGPVFGICVFDVDEQFNPLSTVEDVEISHLSVDGFEIGIIYFHTRDGEITRTIASDYGEYGIFVLDSNGTRIARNLTYNSVEGVNPEAGIYVGDSPNADATVWKNVTYGNHDGIFIRDAAHGKLLNNKTFGNCLGIVFLNTDETAGDPPGEPIDVARWLVKDNLVAANNRTCPAADGVPPLSGLGIAVLGGVDIHLIGNGIYGNKPPAGFTSAFSGGIVVVTSPEFAAPKPSTGTKVGFNTALGNDPDLFWDGAGSGNSFFKNDCITSQPDGLCEDPGHNGDHGDDDHHGGNGHHGDKDDDRGNGHHKGDRHHKKHKKHKSKKHKKHDRDDD
jgi:hypothetical protein